MSVCYYFINLLRDYEGGNNSFLDITSYLFFANYQIRLDSD